MKTITIETTVAAPIERVWECWVRPEHITKWAFASDDWESPYAENDVREGGKFLTRMQAKDGSEGFDLTGAYVTVVSMQKIDSVLDDGRPVQVVFTDMGEGQVKITQEFAMENENSEELQRSGWQAILDNFRKHVEKW